MSAGLCPLRRGGGRCLLQTLVAASGPGLVAASLRFPPRSSRGLLFCVFTASSLRACPAPCLSPPPSREDTSSVGSGPIPKTSSSLDYPVQRPCFQIESHSQGLEVVFKGDTIRCQACGQGYRRCQRRISKSFHRCQPHQSPGNTYGQEAFRPGHLPGCPVLWDPRGDREDGLG